MENPSYIALSMQNGLRRQMEVIANNLANVSTAGFRADRVMFSSLVAGPNSPQGLAGPGAQISFVDQPTSFLDNRDGPLTKTDNALDLAINGDAYFVVEGPDGPRYTRNGAFRLDRDGKIVTQDGLALLDNGGRPLTIPAGASRIEIGKNGSVRTETGQVGRIKLAKFEDEQALQRVGGSLFSSDKNPSDVDAKTEIVQGMIEGSNVQAVTEMTTMIEVMRRYESVQRLIEGENDRSRRAIDKLTRLN